MLMHSQLALFVGYGIVFFAEYADMLQRKGGFPDQTVNGVGHHASFAR